MWDTLLAATYPIALVVAIYCAVRAAVTARTPQGGVGWAVFLLSVPRLALPFYFFFGHHRYRGYRVARRQSARVVEALRKYAAAHAPPADRTDVNIAPFEYCASMPTCSGNNAGMLIDGEATFDAIFKAIDAAETYVLVQFYILRDDRLGRALEARMIAAARRGVTVLLMTDGVGSYGLTRAYVDRLEAGGVRVARRHARGHGARFRFQMNYRNHRKTVVVDGTIGFIGGSNVGDEYMGWTDQFDSWRDTHLWLEGPMVSQLQLIFVEDWHWKTGETLLDDLYWTPTSSDRDATGLIVATGPGDDSDTGSLMFFSAISAAKQRFWIASPYFVPDLDIIMAMRNAALRGVDVRLLVPDMADHHVTWLAAFAYFDEIMEAGVKVYRYTKGFSHQKVFLVDNSVAAVGTTNLDNRSFRLNFEAMAILFDRELATDLERMLSDDFSRATQMTRSLADQPLHIRIGAPVARLFAPLL